MPEEHHGQRILTGYSPRGHKESDTTEHISTTQKKPEILGKMADSRPTRGKYKLNLKHHLIPEHKEMFNEQWGYAITRMNCKKR